MVIFNTKIQKKTGELWSYLDRVEDQIDYILINKKRSNSAKDIGVYNTYSIIGSKHTALRAIVNTIAYVLAKPHNGNHSTTGLLSDQTRTFN